MSYNLNYYEAPSAPCTPSTSSIQKNAHFKTIIDSVLPDILAVNELGAYSDNSAAIVINSNVLNTSGRNYYAHGAYSNNSFSSITNQLFYNSNKFDLISQTNIASSPNNISLTRVIDVYRLYYKDSGLGAPGVDTVFITVCVAHFKAGNTSSDKNDRKLEATSLMDYVENNAPNDNLIFCGDLNLYTASENAYQTLTNYSANSSLSLKDPINAAGSWSNSANYASIHTQSTNYSSSGCLVGGGLDDRFDFILTSPSLISGSKKMMYKTGTYQAFGQDGNHFNSSVNYGSNSAVSANMANALANFSDHLPLIADFDVLVSGLSVSESENLAQSIKLTNPVLNTINITRNGFATQTNLEVSVINLTGVKIHTSTLNAGESTNQISCANWNKGIYLINFRNPQTGKSFTRKLIKK